MHAETKLVANVFCLHIHVLWGGFWLPSFSPQKLGLPTDGAHMSGIFHS